METLATASAMATAMATAKTTTVAAMDTQQLATATDGEHQSTSTGVNHCILLLFSQSQKRLKTLSQV